MKNPKYAFTLLEVLISITLFSIIVLFLYQSLDITHKSNEFYSDKLELKEDENSLKKMFFLDLIHKKGKISPIESDSDKNSILMFESSNTYHNPFYNHITYFISKEQNLIRIESKNKFDKIKLTDSFFDTAFVDIISSDIQKFKVVETKDRDHINIYLNKSLMSF